MTDRYDYAAMTAETVRQAADEGLAEAERLVRSAVDVAGGRTFENTILPVLDAANAVWTADGRGAFVGLVHPDPAVRDAATEAEKRTDGWRVGITRRDDVAAAVRAYAGTEEAKGLAGGRRRMLDLFLRDLRRAGHGLEPGARAELAALDERIVDLAATFGRNVGEWKDELVLEVDDLAGLSAAFVEQLPPGPAPGSRRLEISYAIVMPFLEQSERRDLREAALRKFQSRVVEANRPILEELLDLRRRRARLLGFPSFSQFANEARMSGGAGEVAAFLERTVAPLRRLADRERARMRALLATEGIEDVVQAWDWPYLHERQRRGLGFDSAALAEHFPLDAVLAGLFDVVRDVFGVTVAETNGPAMWHPDVRTFVLSDADTGERLADLVIDLFVRDGKRPGAWQVPLVEAENRPGRDRVPPLVSLVTNFAPASPGRQPLLQHDDVETLFHEFGHVLEFGLQRAESHPLLDTWVELDFVEAPSQIMENWAWSPEVLRRFARHHETASPPPEALLDGLVETERLNTGTRTLWAFAYRAVLDQLLHGPEPVDPAQAYREAFEVTGFPFLEGTYQPASFAHIAAMYAAGFYSYLWARVFGDDMFSAFREGGVLSGEVGRRYRRVVLEPSWSVPGRDRVRTFLGREPSDRAFLERLGILDEALPGRAASRG